MKQANEPLASLNIYPGHRDDLDGCIELMKSLPDSFTQSSAKSFVQDLETQQLLLAKNHKQILGFATWTMRTIDQAELTWLAVRANMQAQGIGTKLMEAVHQQAQASGASEIEVKTLAEGPDSPAYELARRFYKKLGYTLAEVIDPYPGWEPGNPCAIYRKQF